MPKIHWKGGALLAPTPPVMVTCGAGESANIITVAWTGLICTHPPRVSIAIRPTRHSYALIRESGEFVINLTPASLVRVADYCGIYTGAKVDKFAATGLHKEEAQAVSCPIIAECPLALECKVTDVLPQGTHDLFLADVVAVDVDDSIVDGNGKLMLDRAGLAAFAHGEYFALGEKIGNFGCSVAKGQKGKPLTPTADSKPTPASDRSAAPVKKKSELTSPAFKPKKAKPRKPRARK